MLHLSWNSNDWTSWLLGRTLSTRVLVYSWDFLRSSYLALFLKSYPQGNSEAIKHKYLKMPFNIPSTNVYCLPAMCQAPCDTREHSSERGGQGPCFHTAHTCMGGDETVSNKQTRSDHTVTRRKREGGGTLCPSEGRATSEKASESLSEGRSLI